MTTFDTIRPHVSAPPSTTANRIFLESAGPGPFGLSLEDTLALSDALIEQSSGVVEWLFPAVDLTARAGAPEVSPRNLRAGMMRAFVRMLRFHGMEFDGARVRIGGNWDARMHLWSYDAGRGSGHFTRMLRALTLHRLHAEAHALLSFLCGLFSDATCPAELRAERETWRRAAAVTADTAPQAA